MEQENITNFDEQARQGLFNADLERTKYDKLLSQAEVSRLREIMMKEQLSINDISEVLNIAVSNEIKLTNFNEREQYILGKKLIWDGEYAKRFSKALRANEYYEKFSNKLTDRNIELRKEIIKDYTEQFKQNMHAYFYAARSPLSIEGGLIESLTKDRKEVHYNQIPNLSETQVKQGWFK